MSMQQDSPVHKNPVIAAIREQRGLAGKLAAELGITREAVSMWPRVPPRHGPRVADFMKLPLHAVCPEIFPPEIFPPQPTRKVRKKRTATQT